MDNKQIYEKIHRFIEAITPEYNPEKVVLFGSCVRGNTHSESDIDIAVIVKEINGDFLEKEAKLFKIRRNIDINIEPILLESKNDSSGFMQHILSYGEILYRSE